ncbi:MAG: hypothetical protein HS113_25225 [Verrucomicrobiales bacterium]|nr:hypothetical protein [Verrucomicrobiales bacterium]
MKNKLLTLGAILTAAVALLGGKAVWSHLTTMRDEVRTSVRKATPADYEVKRIQALIADLSQDVLAFSDKIAEVGNSAAAQRADIATLEARIAADRTDLLAERNLLAQSDPQVFTIRGTAYSRSQVEASANARLARIARDQATLETKKKAAESLEAAVREGQTRLQESMAARDAKLQEVEILSAQLANAELRRDLDALSAPLRNGAVSRSTELADSMRAFADRVRRVERQTEANALTSTAPSLITHGEAARAGLIEEIDRFMLAPTGGQTNGK